MVNACLCLQPDFNYRSFSYSLFKPNVNISYSEVGSTTGFTHLLANPPTIDFVSTDSIISANDSRLAGVLKSYRSLFTLKRTNDVKFLPFLSGAIALLYNLPSLRYEDGRDEVPRLVLGRETLVGIYSGNITSWQDSRIQADNPGVELPNITITITARSDTSGLTRGNS